MTSPQSDPLPPSEPPPPRYWTSGASAFSRSDTAAPPDHEVWQRYRETHPLGAVGTWGGPAINYPDPRAAAADIEVRGFTVVP